MIENKAQKITNETLINDLQSNKTYTVQIEEFYKDANLNISKLEKQIVQAE